MVKELGYDLNAIYPEFVYRPSFLDNHYMNKPFAMQVAIEQNDISLVKELMELGATIECPDPDMSYFKEAKSAQMKLFLLQNGADPNKRVRVKSYHWGPAFLHCLIDGEDSQEVATFLRDHVDLNTKWQNKSLLHWVLQVSFWASFDVFLEAGVKLEASSLRTLLFKDHNRFYKVMNNKLYIEDNDTAPAVSKNLLYILTLRSVNFPQPTGSTESVEPEQNSKYWVFQDKTPTFERQNIPALWFHKPPTEQAPPSLATPKKKRDDDLLEELPSIDELNKILLASQPVENDDKKPALSETQNNNAEPASESQPKKQPPKLEVKPFDFKIDETLEDSLPKITADSSSTLSKFSFDMPQLSSSAPMSNDNSTTFNLPKNTVGFNFGEQPVAKQTMSFTFSMPQSVTEEPKATELDTNQFERTFNMSYENTLELMKNKINDTTKKGSTALLCACRSTLYHKDKEYRIKALIAYGADVNRADGHGWTPLHAVCYSGDWSLVELLINKGAKLEVQDTNGITPLAAAVYGLHCNSKPIPWYLQAALSNCSADVFKLTESISHRTLVHLLATVASPNDFKIILHKCDVNVKDAMGYTPLHYAIYFGNLRLANFLLENGADPNIQTTALKVTPAMLLVHLLTFATASETEYYTYFRSQMTLFNFRPRTKVSRTPFEFASTLRPPWRNSSRHYKTTQIHRSIKLTGALETLPKLIDKSDPSLADGEGNTLLHLFVRYNLQSAYNYFRTQPELWARKNNVGDTPFVMACRTESFGNLMDASGSDPTQKPNMISIVKQAKIDLNEQDSHGYSPIHYILNSASLLQSIKHEWIASIDTISSTKQGLQMTTLDYCLSQSNLNYELFLSLLKKQPEFVNSRDHLGRTLLMRIIIRMRENSQIQQLLKMVLDYVISKADLDAQDNNGDTALHIACRYFHVGYMEADCNNLKVAKLFSKLPKDLVSSGANANIKNNSGEMPGDYVLHHQRYVI